MSPLTCDWCDGEITPDQQFRVQVICMACTHEAAQEGVDDIPFPEDFDDIGDSDLDDVDEPWLNLDDDDIPPPPPWDEFPPSR